MRKPRFWRLQLLGALLLLAAAASFVLRPGGVMGSIFIRTSVASNGVIERSFSGEGLMVRAELPVTAPVGGVVTMLVEDGQRVPLGQIVAEIREDHREEVSVALDAIDAEIFSLDREAQRLADDMHLRLDGLKRRIKEVESELASALAVGLDQSATTLGETLDGLYKELETTDREFAVQRQALEADRSALVQKRNEVLRSASANVMVVRAPAPGVVSYAYDGLEGRYEPGRVDDALWSEVGQAVALETVADGKQVGPGDTLFRLIDNFESHVFVRFGSSPELVSGQAVWLRWAGQTGPGVRARVLSVHNRADGVGVWFSIDTYDQSFGHLRHLGEVTVVTSRIEGVVVPRRAIAVDNGRPGIYLVADGTPIFRYVSVLGVDAESAVVDRVPAGTRVVTNPKRLMRNAESY